MFSNFFLKSFRILLLPFSLLYWLGVALRNKLYDRKLLRSSRFGLPLIGVGNLSVGGTGKSPMVEYLLDWLRHDYKVATLSRGYKRKTKGYALAGPGSTAIDIGDEPLLFHRKFPEVPVAVGEERLEAIPQLLHDHPETELIILDDAFQHRKVEAGFNILLTEYSNLFTHDFYLPTGDLRDQKSSYRRADVIVVTKCRPDLSPAEKEKITRDIRPLPHQQLYFTCIEYGEPYHIQTGHTTRLLPETEVLLVTGIANPRPLKKMLERDQASYHMLQYADHHIFTIDDFQEIRERFTRLPGTEKIILTTEKDAVRLEKFGEQMSPLPFYVIPVRHRFLFDGEDPFRSQLTGFIQHFQSPA